MRRIAHIQTHEPSLLTIHWRDGGIDKVDLAGVIAEFEPFAPLQKFALFATASIVGYGSGIEWVNGLSYSADSIECLAEEQRIRGEKDRKVWHKPAGLQALPPLNFS